MSSPAVSQAGPIAVVGRTQVGVRQLKLWVSAVPFTRAVWAWACPPPRVSVWKLGGCTPVALCMRIGVGIIPNAQFTVPVNTGDTLSQSLWLGTSRTMGLLICPRTAFPRSRAFPSVSGHCGMVSSLLGGGNWQQQLGQSQSFRVQRSLQAPGIRWRSLKDGPSPRSPGSAQSLAHWRQRLQPAWDSVLLSTWPLRGGGWG